MEGADHSVRPIGWVRSSIADRSSAPKQGDEGAPDAWLELAPEVARASEEIAVGDELLVLTWLHEADRTVLRVRPRDDPANPQTGVFSTRSPDRPNPIGLHRVRVLERDATRLRVSDLEAIDGTPVVDLKPVLGER